MKRIGLAAALALFAASAQAAEPPLAKEIFKDIETPVPGAARSFGGYAKGCLAGGVRLFEDGPTWAAMRLSRGRNWGHPALAKFISRFTAASRSAGYQGLLIGDMGRARGGPMISGHRSHQIGLDVDVWMRPLTTRPSARQREDWSSYDVVKGRATLDRELWDKSAWRAIGIAAQDPAVARIFVNPTIKRELCRASPDAAWLRKVRAWWGHDSHFHVRLSCPAGVPGCTDQAPPPPGDGCGAELDWWFTDEPYQPSGKKPKELTMADLPGACRGVLDAQ